MDVTQQPETAATSMAAARRIVARQSDAPTLAPTTEKSRQEGCTPPDGRPYSDCTGRSPGMTMPEADSARALTSPSLTPISTRSRCDRLTCKPGFRCPEHRAGGTPVPISVVIAELAARWGGAR